MKSSTTDSESTAVLKIRETFPTAMFSWPLCVVLFLLLCGNLLIQGEATETKQMFNLAGAQSQHQEEWR